MTRIAESTRFSSGLASIQRAQAHAQRTATIASTGMKQVRGSDDPAWQREKARLDEAQNANERYKTNLESGRSRLEASDSALSQASGVLIRAQELAMQFANGTYNAAERVSGANEVAGLREAMLAIGNTRTQDGYIFGGFASATQAFDASGNFVGDSNEIRVDGGEGSTASTSVNGSAAFGAAFAALAQLEVALRSNDTTAIQATISSVEASINSVTDGQAGVGARMQVIDTLSARLDDARSLLEERRAEKVEADPIEAYSNLVQANTGLEAALKVSSVSMQKSLLDYL